MVEYRGRLLDSLAQVLHKSPTTRIFLAGRLHIRDEVEKHLAGKAVAVSVKPTKDDIIIPTSEARRGYNTGRDG